MSDRVVEVRAFVASDEGTIGSEHWVEGTVASPLAWFGEYADRITWGVRRFGSVVVEVETASGHVGVGQVGVAGHPAAWIVENFLAQFAEGARVSEVGLVWERMHRASMHIARRGIGLHALSAVDLAMWDALGKVRELPVYELLGGAVRERLPVYATGPRPDVAAKLGFHGAKLPITHGSAAGVEGRRKNVEQFAAFREQVGPDFPLAVDCWMSFDRAEAAALSEDLAAHGLWFIEEALDPDDYEGFADLRRRLAGRALVATGEHEGTLAGFRRLLEGGCVDIVQPDLGWAGGLTEVLRVAALADAHRVPVLLHSGGQYGTHFSFARAISPMGEILMPGPQGDETDLAAWLPAELVPVDGFLLPPQAAGFGVSVDTRRLERPYTHERTSR